MTESLIVPFIVVTAVWLMGIIIFRKSPLMIAAVCIAYIGVIMFYILPMSAVPESATAAYQQSIQDAACREAHQCLNRT